MTNRKARLMILIPHDMLAAIDVYRRAQGDIPPRTEAIRRLIGAGLDVTTLPPSKRMLPPSKQRAA
jgi:hypothetical protein